MFASIVALLIMGAVLVAGYRFYVDSLEAKEAKLRLEADLLVREKAESPLKHVFQERRFGTAEERNAAEAAPDRVAEIDARFAALIAAHGEPASD